MLSYPIQNKYLNHSHTLFKGLLISLPVVVLLIIAVQTLFYLAHLRVNLTASMPIGLYKKLPHTAFSTGDIIASCLSGDIAKIGRKNKYLTRGTCPASSAPVLKKVIAVPNDTVTVTNNAIIVNGKSYPAPRRTLDRLGRVIPTFVKIGTYKAKGFWLYGAHRPNHSWDSRYFGEVPASDVIGVFKPVFTL